MHCSSVHCNRIQHKQTKELYQLVILWAMRVRYPGGELWSHGSGAAAPSEAVWGRGRHGHCGGGGGGTGMMSERLMRNRHKSISKSHALAINGIERGRLGMLLSIHLKQNWFSYFLPIQWTNRCHLAAITFWQQIKATTARWPLFVICILRKWPKQFSLTRPSGPGQS